MCQDNRGVPPKPRYVYRGLEARDDPSNGLTVSDPQADLSPHDAVSAHVSGRDVHCTQFLHCSHSVVAAIFYGSKWGGVQDARVVKIDLQKVKGYVLHDISSTQGARRHGLSGKAVELATDCREILLEAALHDLDLFIPPTAMSLHDVSLDALSDQQRKPLRHWKRLLQSGQRMETFCALTPSGLEAYIVGKIYEPRIYYLAASANVYHFNGACPAKEGADISFISRQRPEGCWRACQHCMMLGTGSHLNEEEQPRNLCGGNFKTPFQARHHRRALAAVGSIVKRSSAQRLASLSLESWISYVGGTFGSMHPDLCRSLKDHYGSFKAFVVDNQAEIPRFGPLSHDKVTLELKATRATLIPDPSAIISITSDNSISSFGISPSALHTLPTVCHFFWYALDAPPGELEMRLLNLYSLRSAAIHHTVWLWCYQSFSNLPVSVVVKDANELLSFDMFRDTLNRGSTEFDRKRKVVEKGRHVAHLSDLLRVRVLRRFGGWWLDMDTIVLKRLPTALPYYFSTIAEKQKNDRRAVTNGNMWAGHNPACPHWDGKGSFQNTPIYIKQPEDPLTIEWDSKLTELVLKPCLLPWLEIIRQMETSVVSMGLQRFVCPPINFCPYPFWSMDARTPLDFSHTTYATGLPSFDTVVQHSFTIQTFFMSSSSNQTKHRDDSWLQKEMKRDCDFSRLIAVCAVEH
jgi:hypothetical protein